MTERKTTPRLGDPHRSLIEGLDGGRGRCDWEPGGDGGGGNWHVAFRGRFAKFRFQSNGECDLHLLYIPEEGTDPDSRDHNDKLPELLPDAYWILHKLMLEQGK